MRGSMIRVKMEKLSVRKLKMHWKMRLSNKILKVVLRVEKRLKAKVMITHRGNNFRKLNRIKSLSSKRYYRSLTNSNYLR